MKTVEQRRAYARDYYRKNTAKVKAYGAAWYQRNRHRADLRNNEWSKKHPETKRANRRLKEYGLPHTQYEEMVTAQAGLCALCRLNKQSQIDHDHRTGAVRGLLCKPCNLALGGFERLVEVASVKAVLQYLNPSHRALERI